MASGKAHASTSIIASVPTGLLVGATATDPIEGVGAALGCLSGIFLTPDLDQEGFSAIEHWLIRKTWLFGFAWLALWYPYARATRHRAWLSHCPIVGTVGRLVYCALWIGLAWAVLGRPDLPAIPVWGGVFFWGWLKGLAVSDTAHWAMDLPLTKRKKGKR